MTRDEFSELFEHARDWVTRYAGENYFNSLDLDYVVGGDEDVLFVDLVQHSISTERKARIRENTRDFQDIGKAEVRPSNWVTTLKNLNDRWYPVILAAFDGVVIETEKKIWIVVPKGMIYEQR